MGSKVLDFNKAEECTGCSVCSSVCPSGAITFTWSEAGFVIPSVDEAVCIGCRKCEQACLALSRPKDQRPYFLSGFVFSSHDRSTVQKSASGGAFAELAFDTVDAGGCACGCVWTDSFVAEHRMARNRSDVEELESSKYVQSSTIGIYEKVKQEIDSGRKVVFGGTPCQVEALGRFCGQSQERLLLVSVVCRGAASPIIWSAYKRGLEFRAGSRLVAVDQRDKSMGYGRSMCRYEFENGAVIRRSTYVSDVYTNCFVNGIALRGSCHSCPAKGYDRADVILGDDVLRAGHSEGSTLVLCVTSKGDAWVRKALSRRGSLLELDDRQLSLVPEKSNMLFGSSPSHDELSERIHRDLNQGIPADKALMCSLPAKQRIKVWLDRVGALSLIWSLKVRAHD